MTGPHPRIPAATAPCSEPGSAAKVIRAATFVGIIPCSAIATSSRSRKNNWSSFGSRPVSSRWKYDVKLTLPMRSSVRLLPRTSTRSGYARLMCVTGGMRGQFSAPSRRLRSSGFYVSFSGHLEVTQRGAKLMKSVVGVALGLVVLAVTFPAAAVAKGGTRLETYTLEGDAAAVAKATQGVELAGLRRTAAGIRADAVLTRDERSKAQALGVSVKLTRNKKGQTVREQARAMAVGGYNVWRSWDEPGGIRDDLHALAARNPQLVKLEVLGHTYQGRELIALKVTQGAQDVPDGSRAAVLYSSNQHAREWISLEVNRRLLHWYVDRWRANDKDVKNILKNTELWFVISANPDGYQYTFDHERLWRKNLRDNNGDGQITPGDGVDPNRNFAEHWGWDNEGSSPDQADETYRGPSAGSEPETQFMSGLIRRIKPKFQSNLHSYGPW